MNELLQLSARIWRTTPALVLGKSRHEEVTRARYSFVLLSILGGFTKGRIMEFTGWSSVNVDFYAGRALTDDLVIETLEKRNLISFS